MDEHATTELVRTIMTAFAERTGLTGRRSPVRYLWTDAFAVCNFVELERRTGEPEFRQLALRLVAQVHRVLGYYRDDDARTGPISGLDAAAAPQHPTLGGLRIGKPLPERGADEPHDERLEWDRDGQYFHYLTRWMHALTRVGQVTGESSYLRWAKELAKTAYARFTYAPEFGGQRRMYWKMSTDLSRPLVEAMGQHDPLDGLATLAEVQAASADRTDVAGAELGAEITNLADMCRGLPLATRDPLGVGGLLTSAHTLAGLVTADALMFEDILRGVLDAALPGLHDLHASPDLSSPDAAYRLAFRELGLALGLKALPRMRRLVADRSAEFAARDLVRAQLHRLLPYATLCTRIERFWLNPANRRAGSWKRHEDINAVMLATTLAPSGYLGA